MPEAEDVLVRAREATLKRYRAYLEGKKRIFVLIHGFNNDDTEANHAYELIKQRIAFEPGDGVVEFYWDGLAASYAAPAKIWFNATGYSQLAGTRGLRKLLNETHDKEVVFITHSRGASVLFSALSNPPFDPDFERDTKWGINFNEDELKENRNEFKALLLAPALGRIDFNTPSHDFPRDFDSQLKEVYFSVNSKDPTLNKYVWLSGSFNPTNMGLKEDAAEEIASAYKPAGRFHYDVWQPMKEHGFDRYVKNREFKVMLQAMNVKVEP